MFLARLGPRVRGVFCVLVADCGRGFADGLGVLGGLGLVFELIGEACGREGAGFGFDQGFTGVGNAFDGFACAVEVFGVEDGCELGEFEVVELAEFEGGEGGVDEVFEEGAGEFVRRVVRVHVRIFAHRRGDTRGD